VQARLRRELTELELAGLEERAQAVRRELGTVDGRLADMKAERQEAQQGQWHAQAEQAERQRRREQAERERAEKRAEADAWFREHLGWRANEPQPMRETLEAAAAEGVDLDVLAAVTERVQRKRDGVACLALPGRYLRRDYFRPDAA
jgi:chromosome segregation ATPase